MPVNRPDIFSQSGFDREIFLSEYWQKRSLLIRRAVRQSDLTFLPDKTTLLALAQKDDAQSRVVLTEGDNHFSVEYGPFHPEDWPALAATGTPWTVLVSDVEKWLPSNRRLLHYFPFIRHWLFDDLMFSHSTTGASVGPHSDHYDVFLLQVEGRKQWQYNDTPQSDAPELADSELKILHHFQPDRTEILEPGDLLYLPAEVPHHGVALDDDCITCSVGLRAPAIGELLAGYFEDKAAALSDAARFSPAPEEARLTAPAEITAMDIMRLRHEIKAHLALDDDQLGRWFGRFITRYRSLFFELESNGEPAISLSLSAAVQLAPDPFSRLAYRRLDNHRAQLFVNGQSFDCSVALAQQLADRQSLTGEHIATLDDNDKNVLKQLLESREIRIK